MIQAQDPGGRGLSLGDRLCLALAMRLELPVVTGTARADCTWSSRHHGRYALMYEDDTHPR
ncbi:hypothetical protein BH24ACT8_BH24ACT8_11020 [soil metagenome]